jgi:hypothetical protein
MFAVTAPLGVPEPVVIVTAPPSVRAEGLVPISTTLEALSSVYNLLSIVLTANSPVSKSPLEGAAVAVVLYFVINLVGTMPSFTIS